MHPFLILHYCISQLYDLKKMGPFHRSPQRYSFLCSVEDVTIASSPLRRYDIVTKNRYSDPETEKSRGSRKNASGADECRSSDADARASISVIGVRGRRLIDDPRDRNDVSQDVVSFARVSNFFPRSSNTMANLSKVLN